MKVQIIIGMDKNVLSVSIQSIGIILILNAKIAQISKYTILILETANTALNKTLISTASTAQFAQITNSITPSSINANLVAMEKFITLQKWFANAPRLILSRQLKVVYHAIGLIIFLSVIRPAYLVKKILYLTKPTQNVSHVHLIHLYSTRQSAFLVLITHSLTPY